MGTRSQSRKLTPQKAVQIFRLYHVTGMSQRHIAAEYGVSRSCVYGVTHGETWTEFTRPLSKDYRHEGAKHAGMILRGAVFMD